jgi:uncharacterized protein (DUF927 family)
MGLFENLHGATSAREFADSLQLLAEQYHGTAAEALLEHLTSDPDELAKAVSVVIGHQATFRFRFIPRGASSQVQRAGSRFGLLAGIGEYCAEIGVLPWKPEEATKGIRDCFLAWLEGRGGAQSTEEIRALAQVRAFIERHGEARFTPLLVGASGMDDMFARTVNRAGFKTLSNEHGIEYWVLPEVFQQEICQGFDPKAVAKLLREKGVLLTDTQGRNSMPKRIPGFKGTVRVYVITGAILANE